MAHLTKGEVDRDRHGNDAGNVAGSLSRSIDAGPWGSPAHRWSSASFPGHPDAGDGVNHYQHARYAWQHAEVALSQWGKPVFSLLASPFSMLGLTGDGCLQRVGRDGHVLGDRAGPWAAG